MAIERLQKILARGGIASRRAAEEMITSGRVRVNGHVVNELGAKADSRNDRIDVDNTRVIAEDFVYLVVHKPRGVVTTLSDPEGRASVKDLIKGINARVFPVGRLDFDTSGVLLLSNDGDFANGLLHPKKAVPKEYVVKTQGVMSEKDIDRWRKGVELDDGVTRPAQVSLIRHEGEKTWLSIVISEGRNHQIRRMGEATRFPVMRLARMTFAGITVEGLPPGKFRHMTRDELTDLKKAYGVPRSMPRATSSDSDPRPRRTAASGGGGDSRKRPVRPDAHGRVDAGRGDPRRRGDAAPRGSRAEPRTRDDRRPRQGAPRGDAVRPSTPRDDRPRKGAPPGERARRAPPRDDRAGHAKSKAPAPAARRDPNESHKDRPRKERPEREPPREEPTPAYYTGSRRRGHGK